ncbi:MAG: DUF4276 family protein [Pseudomonas sp.]
MPGRIVFMLEEPSMKVLLDGLLPRLFPGLVEGRDFLCIKHDGKSDLERSLRTKLRAWRIAADRFVVVRDNDGGDCRALKLRLTALCAEYGRPDTLVRLVCQELESWYLGDLKALAAAYPQARPDTPAHRKRFADPDACFKPSREVARLAPAFQKLAAARAMAATLEPERNRSPSFRVFVNGVARLLERMHEAGGVA